MGYFSDLDLSLRKEGILLSESPNGMYKRKLPYRKVIMIKNVKQGEKENDRKK